MAEFNSNKVRAVSIELKEHLIDHYMRVAAIYAAISGWRLHCGPDTLPSPFDVNMQLKAYAGLEIAELRLTDWIEELSTAQYGDTLSTLPPCESSAGTGTFDGSATFDGQTTFNGGN